MKIILKSWWQTLSLLLLCSVVHGQQFKWVRGGGSTQDLSSSLSTSEQVHSMCTDQNGNIYAVSIVGSSAPIVADTFHLASGGYGAAHNIFISSYNCSGQMRWAKFIGSSYDCTPIGISADKLGNIFVAGYYNQMGGSFQIGYDTIISPATYYTTGVIQFDTSGHFNWIKFIGNNSIQSITGVGDIGTIITDANNNAHLFVCMGPHVPIMPGDTTHYGNYEFVYNTTGTMLSAVRLDLDSQWEMHQGVIDSVTGKLYMCGEINQFIYGGTATDTFYAAAFDASRNLLWMYFDNNSATIEGISMDKNKFLHFTNNSGTGTIVFNGDTVMNLYSGYAVSSIMTTDTNGTPLAFKKFSGNTNINALLSITQSRNNNIAAAGMFGGIVTDGMVAVNSGSAQEPFLAILDSASALISLQKIFGNGFFNGATAISSDKTGSLYIGGYVTDSVYAMNGSSSIPAYHSIGGNTDFFIMKYGYDCNCTSTPIPVFNDTGTHLMRTYFYTGTGSNIDSIVWNFGDGIEDTGIIVAHTYALYDTYRVCVYVYSGCGNDSVCVNTIVEPPVGVQFNFAQIISVYPNPVKDELIISGIQQISNFILQDAMGTVYQHGTFQQKNTILSLKNYPLGVYILEIENKDGIRSVFKVEKE